MDTFSREIRAAVFYNPKTIGMAQLEHWLDMKWNYLLTLPHHETDDLKKLRMKIQQLREVSYWTTWGKWLQYPQQEIIDHFLGMGLSAPETADAIISWLTEETSNAIGDVERLLPPPTDDID